MSWWIFNPYVRALVNRRDYEAQVSGLVLHRELHRMDTPMTRRLMHLVREMFAVHGPHFSIRDVIEAGKALAKVPGPEHADARRDCDLLAGLMIERANVIAIYRRRAKKTNHRRPPLPFKPRREARAMALAYGFTR